MRSWRTRSLVAVAVAVLVSLLVSVTPASAGPVPKPGQNPVTTLVSQLVHLTLQALGTTPTVAVSSPAAGATVDATDGSFEVKGSVKGPLAAPFTVELSFDGQVRYSTSVAKSGGAFSFVVVAPSSRALSFNVVATAKNGQKDYLARSVKVTGPALGAEVVDPDVQVLGPAAAPLLVDVAARSATLPAGTATVGKVLVAGVYPTTPEGWMATIESVSTNPDGTQSVLWRPAALTEVFVQADFSAAFGLDPSTGTVGEPVLEGFGSPPATRTAAPAGWFARAMVAADGEAAEVSKTLKWSLPFSYSKVHCTEGESELPDGGESEVEGCAKVDVNLQVNFDSGFEYGARISRDWAGVPYLANANARVWGGMDGSVAGSVAGNLEAEVEREIFKRTFPPVTVAPGGIPVVLSPRMAVSVGTEVNVAGRVDAEARASVKFDWGARCSQPAPLVPVTCSRDTQPDDQGVRHGASYKAVAEGTLWQGVIVDFGVKANGFSALDAEGRLGHKLTLDQHAQSGSFATYRVLSRIMSKLSVRLDVVLAAQDFSAETTLLTLLDARRPEVLDQPGTPDLTEVPGPSGTIPKIRVDWGWVPQATYYELRREGLVVATSTEPTALVDAFVGVNTFTVTAFSDEGRSEPSNEASITVVAPIVRPGVGLIETVVGGSRPMGRSADIGLSSPVFTFGAGGVFFVASNSIMWMDDETGIAYPVAGDGGLAERFEGTASEVGFGRSGIVDMQWDPYAASTIPTAGGPTLPGALIVGDGMHALRRVADGQVASLGKVAGEFSYRYDSSYANVVVTESAYYATRHFTVPPAGPDHGDRVVRIDRATGEHHAILPDQNHWNLGSLVYDYESGRLFVVLYFFQQARLLEVHGDGTSTELAFDGSLGPVQGLQLSSSAPAPGAEPTPIVGILTTGTSSDTKTFAADFVGGTLSKRFELVGPSVSHFRRQGDCLVVTARSSVRDAWVGQRVGCSAPGRYFGGATRGGQPSSVSTIQLSLNANGSSYDGNFAVDPSTGDIYLDDASGRLLRVRPNKQVEHVAGNGSRRVANSPLSYPLLDAPLGTGMKDLRVDPFDGSLWLVVPGGTWHLAGGSATLIHEGSTDATPLGDGTALVLSASGRLDLYTPGHGLTRFVERCNNATIVDVLLASDGNLYSTELGGDLCRYDRALNAWVDIPGTQRGLVVTDIGSDGSMLYIENVAAGTYTSAHWLRFAPGDGSPVVTLAGSGALVGWWAGYQGDGIGATSVRLGRMNGAAFDHNGDVLFSAQGHNRIYRVGMPR